jgi:hypothetical protein
MSHERSSGMTYGLAFGFLQTMPYYGNFGSCIGCQIVGSVDEDISSPSMRGFEYGLGIAAHGQGRKKP